MRFPKVQSTFGVTPYNPERDTDEKRRAIFEHYQSQIGAQPLPPETLPWNKPFPPGVEAQQAFDTMLQERVVDPLARAGYEDLGAGLAAIPSAAHEMIVPQTEFDVAGTIIPLPGVAKAMKQGKYRKIRAAMKAEDPEKVGEIIAKQAGKTELPITQKANPAEVRSIDEKEMLRKADEANLKENQIFQKMSDDSIRDGIKEKYDIEGENWSVLEDNPETQFGISDLSGKRGEVIEITDGDITIQVLSDEYLDMMGLSGGIPLSETPFAQSMKKNKKALTPSDQTIERVIKTAEKGEKLTRPSRSQLEKAMSESKKAIEAGEDVEFHKERFKKIKELLDLTSKPGSADAPKPPKGDPEASLRGPFQSIRSQLDVAPARMDERGRSFENIGQSDFMPYKRPQVGQFEDVQKRNYVERDLDPKEKMWNEIVASDPYLLDNPEYLKNLRNYFDNRWEQEQGTVEGKMMQFDMPMSEKLKPRDEKSVTSGYIDELAFKKFAEPYDKIIQAQRLLAKKPGNKPVRTAIIDDKMESYFGNETKSPGRRLQDQMYPKKSR